MRLKKKKQKHQIQRKVGTLPKEICSQKWGQQKSQVERKCFAVGRVLAWLRARGFC